MKVSRLGDISIVRKSQKLRGSIDEAEGFHIAQLTVPVEQNWTGKIEVLSGEKIKAAVNWGSGKIDFGSISASNRLMFAVPGNVPLPKAVTLYVSSGKAVDVIFR